MTVSATARPVSGGQVAGSKQAPAGKRREGGRSRSSRLPVDHLLPEEVLSELHQHAVEMLALVDDEADEPREAATGSRGQVG